MSFFRVIRKPTVRSGCHQGPMLKRFRDHLMMHLHNLVHSNWLYNVVRLLEGQQSELGSSFTKDKMFFFCVRYVIKKTNLDSI